MNTSWRSELPQLAIVVAMFAWSAALWPSASESLPVHFDITGNVDRYGGKFEGLFLMPIAALAVYLLLRFMPRLDPARANYVTFASAYTTMRFALMVVLCVIDVALLLPVAGVAVNQIVLVRLAIGGLFVAFGAVMGKIRPNWFVGIRTPWTLASKESWVKTHRLSGWVFILSGVAFIASLPFAAVPGFVLSFGVLGLGIIWTVVYSYLVWRADPVGYPAIGTRPADDSLAR